MRLPRLLPGRLICRPNRFGAWVEAEGGALYLHVPNSGRLREILRPGGEVRWLPRPAEGRKTVGDVILGRAGRVWVGADARLPPKLLAEAAARPEGLEPFGRCAEAAFEPPLGEGRADVLMQCGRRRWIVETKSATLRRGAVAMFPDALTERGTRHLRELGDVARDGPADLRPAVAFVCQRPDVFSFTPNAEGDPDFAEALHAAREAGVLVVAYRCEVGPRAIAIAERIPVRLGRRGR